MQCMSASRPWDGRTKWIVGKLEDGDERSKDRKSVDQRQMHVCMCWTLTTPNRSTLHTLHDIVSDLYLPPNSSKAEPHHQLFKEQKRPLWHHKGYPLFHRLATFSATYSRKWSKQKKFLRKKPKKTQEMLPNTCPSTKWKVDGEKCRKKQQQQQQSNKQKTASGIKKDFWVEVWAARKGNTKQHMCAEAGAFQWTQLFSKKKKKRLSALFLRCDEMFNVKGRKKSVVLCQRLCL